MRSIPWCHIYGARVTLVCMIGQSTWLTLIVPKPNNAVKCEVCMREIYGVTSWLELIVSSEHCHLLDSCNRRSSVEVVSCKTCDMLFPPAHLAFHGTDPTFCVKMVRENVKSEDSVSENVKEEDVVTERFKNEDSLTALCRRRSRIL